MSQRTHTVKLGNVVRESFGKIKETVDIPYLIEVQKKSYESFLTEGIREVLDDFSPMVGTSNKYELDFLDIKIEDKCKYSVKECKDRDVTYTFSLRVKVRLTSKETGEINEQEIFLGEYPKMTDNGTFIINGAERVVVSQLVRSPGVYCEEGVLDKNGILRFSTQAIPVRGAWLEFIQEIHDTLSVRVDRKKKINATILLRALGFGDSKDIARIFGNDPLILNTLDKDGDVTTIEKAKLEAYTKLKPGENPLANSVEVHLPNLFFDRKRYDLTRVGRYMFNKHLSLARRIEGLTLAKDVVKEGEILFEAGEVMDLKKGWEIQNAGINEVYVKTPEGFKDIKVHESGYLNEHEQIDPQEVGIEGKVYLPFLREIRKAHEGDKNDKAFKKAIKDNAELLTIPEGYTKVVGNNTVQLDAFIDVSPETLGIKENVYYPVLKKLIDQAEGDMETLKASIIANASSLVVRHLTIDDIIAATNANALMRFKFRKGDNIDHLSNRRVRAVGELLQIKFREGMGRMERIVRERMLSQKPEDITPMSLVNVKPITSCIREFFGTSQLSQFMDQPNPIAELTHKRKLSALGPGGLNRERAGFEVRDVHHSHYGRMCPIETPEGQNIGLITSLSSYARVNRYGFIETPYRKVDKKTGVVTETVEYLAADEEDRYVVAQANEPLDENQRFVKKRVLCRYQDLIKEYPNSEVDYMDVSPQQLVSIATSLIPFLENDDAQRALMGSNMQRQAVPLLRPEAPIVGTGMEYKVALDSGVCVVSKEEGVVSRVTADFIEVKNKNGIIKYELQKFTRSNQGTCMNQKPLVIHGQKVKANEIIADGPSTDKGELALGRNILVGFMPWEGYNYEDAILISEELVKGDVFTSIHIDKYEIDSRTTKLGDEEITRDIPNVNEDYLKYLDENGIVMIGAEVRAGDYLVGKVTPKGETEPTPEEKLLRSIFGDKSRDVRDVSLKVPNGEGGTVVDVKVFTRENKDEQLSANVLKLVRVYIAQKRKIGVGDKMAGRHGNKGVISRVLPKEDMPFLEDGTSLQIVLNPLGVPSRMNIGQVLEVHLAYACKALGIKIATPVFDGATENDIKDILTENGVHYTDPATGIKYVDGKFKVFDGRTGEPFDNRVTVGYMYMLKLIHLVDDKIHARSIGPYSLVTQQPLGGKAQMGGQRFGEMEVWALEAYGAAYMLQEMLTVKSDDVNGRNKMYNSILESSVTADPGIPESFKVLQKELQSLCIDVKLLTEGAEEIPIPSSAEEADDYLQSHRTEPTDESKEEGDVFALFKKATKKIMEDSGIESFDDSLLVKTDDDLFDDGEFSFGPESGKSPLDSLMEDDIDGLSIFGGLKGFNETESLLQSEFAGEDFDFDLGNNTKSLSDLTLDLDTMEELGISDEDEGEDNSSEDTEEEDK
ncbi:MAG: DNA-directed RNA polymerase subunit beta [Clostridiales bacterium]|nr:DNA-directed RNA polymerase subunit beta [Clostridiales bacterium]